MLKYRKYKASSNNELTDGKVYAKAVVNQTIGIDGLASHMSKHNTVFSRGVIKGLLTDMVDCIQELTLEGIAVKIDDLAIFSVGIKSTGAESAEQFSAQENIKEMDDYDGKLSA